MFLIAKLALVTCGFYMLTAIILEIGLLVLVYVKGGIFYGISYRVWPLTLSISTVYSLSASLPRCCRLRCALVSLVLLGMADRDGSIWGEIEQISSRKVQNSPTTDASAQLVLPSPDP